MNNIIIIGAFHEIIELAAECGYNIVGIIDNTIKNNYRNIKILGTDLDAEEIYRTYSEVPLVISPDKPQVRKELYDFYSKIGFKFQSMLSPRAQISESVVLGRGILVHQNVTITSDVTIKDGVRLNVNACIMHDSVIGDFTTIAPCSVILGHVTIDEGAYIGANATVLPFITIGAGAVIVAGAVVNRDIGPNIVAAGVPAKQID